MKNIHIINFHNLPINRKTKSKKININWTEVLINANMDSNEYIDEDKAKYKISKFWLIKNYFVFKKYFTFYLRDLSETLIRKVSNITTPLLKTHLKHIIPNYPVTVWKHRVNDKNIIDGIENSLNIGSKDFDILSGYFSHNIYLFGEC